MAVIDPYAAHALYFWQLHPVLQCSRPGSARHLPAHARQVYCDNILIFSKTRVEHLVHVLMVLETLSHHKLYAKASKCQFCCASVGILGHHL